MSATRTRPHYILHTGALNIDNMLPALNAFIEKYHLSLDIFRIKTVYAQHALSITLWLFAGPTYVDSDEFLDMNPAFSFFKAISEGQKVFSVHNNTIDLQTNIQLPYMPRTITITDKNAHGLGQEIENHLKENDQPLDKKYFLAKLEHNLQQEKWLTKGMDGLGEKPPGHIQQLKDVFTQIETDEHTKFNQIADIIESAFKGFFLFNFLFRHKEVNELYAKLKEQILAIQKKEAEINQQPRTTMEMDVISKKTY